jgi:predicted TIM-barrel fold metal-dependent hydrolase
MDKNWKGLRDQVPWLEKPPSEYIREQVWFTTQPIEETDDPNHLIQIFDMMHAEETLMFSSDYPHWDGDDPRYSLPNLDEPIRSRLFFRNAKEVYELPNDPTDLG